MSVSDNPQTGAPVPAEELGRRVLRQASAAAEALQRVECLDEEQRAEIHAILEALRHESQPYSPQAATWGSYVPVRPSVSDERAGLREHFVEIVSAVSAAVEEFERRAQGAADARVGREYQRLAREERRHLMLAERLLEILNE